MALLIVLAFFLRNSVPLTGHGPLEEAAAIARSLIYAGLFTAWGVSLYRRIIQMQARKYLIVIAVMMVFWIAVRTLKFRLFQDPLFDRICWYSYYVPMLLIPMLSLFSAVAIGKPESYRTPKWMHILWVPTILLVLFVLTNDLHQMVFRFPPGQPWTDDEYSYAPGYWAVAAWALCSAAVALGTVLHKCRLPHRKKLMWLPLIPFALIALYTVGYVLRWEWQDFIMGDMTVTLCLLIAAIFESCIQCGLIQSNTHYNELFRASTIAAQITDEAYRVALSSDTAMRLSADVMARTADAPVILPENIRLSGAPITGGHVLWTEDVSELAGVISALEDLDEDLEGKRTVLREEYQTSQKRQSLVEKNRLYNEMQTQTEEKITRLSELTERLSDTRDAGEIRLLTVEIALLAAYLKRRNNLIFIAEESGNIPASELTYCLKESVSNLRLCGADCHLQVLPAETLPFEQITAIYDAFEAAAEASVSSLKELFVAVSMQGGAPVLCLNILCGADLSGLSGYGFDVVREDEREWTLTMGGDRV